MIKFKSVFLKNVIALFKGNVVFQATIILTLIFLSRHYSPNEIGQYAVFISIISIISTVAPGRLEMAIMLPKNEKEAYIIYRLSTISILLIALLFVIICVVLHYTGIYFSLKEIMFIPLLCLGIVCVALNVLQIQFLNRLEHFKVVSNGKIICALVITSLQVLSALSFKHVFALVFSYVLGFTISALYYNNILRDYISGYNCSKVEMKLTLKRYQNFPKINNLSSLFNIIANQGPVIILEIVYGSAISGFYAVAQRTLNAPSSLVGMAFSQVFYKKVTNEVSSQKTKAFMFDSLKYLCLISIAILLVIMLFSDFLYVMVFGKEYIISAKMARVLIVFYILRLLFNSMISLIIAKDKLGLDLMFNIIYAFGLLTPALFGWLFNLEWLTVVYMMSVNGALCFLYLGYLLFKKL